MTNNSKGKSYTGDGVSEGSDRWFDSVASTLRSAEVNGILSSSIDDHFSMRYKSSFQCPHRMSAFGVSRW